MQSLLTISIGFVFILVINALTAMRISDTDLKKTLLIRTYITELVSI
ncbi:MAG: hypothetical protein RSC24_12515 [Clostridium sp.]